MYKYKEGFRYEIGIAIATDKNNLSKAGNKNLKGAPKELR